MDLDLEFSMIVFTASLCAMLPLEEFPDVGFHIGRPALSMDV